MTTLCRYSPMLSAFRARVPSVQSSNEGRDLSADRAADVLDEMGILVDDRVPAHDRNCARHSLAKPKNGYGRWSCIASMHRL